MDSPAQEHLVVRAREGDERALAQCFELQRPRLERMVELRLDPGLRRRLDPADVVQEAWLEIARRFAHWRSQAELPMHLWMRLVTAQSLAQAQRRHLGADMRDAQREVALASGPASRAGISAANVADAFAASATSPSQAAARAELRVSVLRALEELDELDREIVALRQFEGLSNEDAAAELEITPAAASKRFLRALVRLRPALQLLGGEAGGPAP